MGIEAQPMHRRPQVAVAEHAFGAVAERQDHQSRGANRSGGRGGVQRRVVRSLRAGAPQPAIQNTGPVQAQQHPVARAVRGMVDVHEGVDPRLRIVVRAVGHPIHHPGSTGGGRYGTRLQHAQRQRVVGLVAGAVGERDAAPQPQLGGRRGGKFSLRREGGHHFRHQRRVDGVMVQQEVGAPAAGKIPQHPLRQPRRGSRPFAGEPPGEVVARQQQMRRRGGNARLLLDHPAHLRGGEVARRVEQAPQRLLAAQLLQCAVADGHRPAVAPDDGGPQHRAGGVSQHQAVHLIGNADRLHRRQGAAGARRAQHAGGRGQVLPPGGRILLRPAGPRRRHRQLGRRRGGRRHLPPAVDRHQRRLDRGAADVVAQQVSCHFSPSSRLHDARAGREAVAMPGGSGRGGAGQPPPR